MDETYPKILEHARKLVKEGELKESFDELAKIKSGGNLDPDEKFELCLLQGNLYLMSRRYDLSLVIGEELLKESIEQDNFLHTIKAFNIKFWSFNHQNNLKPEHWRMASDYRR